ncbi:MAG: hypothetical protein K8F25_11990 [Fimbriimonadaceae bacterium]|nr:hypothetical protein [Alphaproteobacteria bacterium]
MSQTKNEQVESERRLASGDNLEDQYRDIGISAVAAAAAYTCKAAKLSQKT